MSEATDFRREKERRELMLVNLGRGHDSGGMPPDETDRRLTKLEGDMTEVKGSLQRLETGFATLNAKLDAILPTLATKADLATVGGKVDAMDGRLGGVEKRLELVERLVTAKLPSWWQVPAAIVATGGGVGLLYGAWKAIEKAGII